MVLKFITDSSEIHRDDFLDLMTTIRFLKFIAQIHQKFIAEYSVCFLNILINVEVISICIMIFQKS